MNIKRMENMIDEISESLQNHILSSKNTYYYVMQQNLKTGELAIKVYSSGGKSECEVICMPDYSSEGEITCSIKIDGEEAAQRKGMISSEEIDLPKGYHTLEFVTSANTASSRVRLTGALTKSTILSL